MIVQRAWLFLRNDMEEIVRRAAAISSLEDIQMVTNGVRLAGRAERLRASGHWAGRAEIGPPRED